MSEYKKPLPLITEQSKVFWDGCKKRKLLYQKCNDCGEVIFLPKHLCPNCWSKNLSWAESSGNGRIHTFTVTYEAAPPEFMADMPYCLAVIKLEEGFRMMSNIIDCDFEALQCEQPVHVVFKDVTPEITLPVFAP